MDLALPPRKRREFLRILISASPYRRVLSRYEDQIDRIAAGHAQIAQIMAEVYPEEPLSRRAIGRGSRANRQIRLLQDFLEFIYFSTPEIYKGISGEQPTA